MSTKEMLQLLGGMWSIMSPIVMHHRTPIT